MTWHYSISDDGSSMTVYDHTGAEVATVQNDGGGFRIPNDVLDVMYSEAIDAYNGAGGTVNEYSMLVLADAAFEQIDQGAP